MKPLETLICAGPIPLADRPGLTADCSGPGGSLLPRGEEAFDWRLVRARLLERERRDLEAAKGAACPVEKARRHARADVWLTAAQEVEAEAKRKGLAS